MPVILRARVQAISPDRLSLTLATGEQVSIPRTTTPAPDKMDRYAVGDEVTITLTRSADLINELLRNKEDNHDEDKEKNGSAKTDDSKV